MCFIINVGERGGEGRSVLAVRVRCPPRSDAILGAAVKLGKPAI